MDQERKALLPKNVDLPAEVGRNTLCQTTSTVRQARSAASVTPDSPWTCGKFGNNNRGDRIAAFDTLSYLISVIH